MLYLLVAVEGESEKGLIDALVRKLAAQAPISYGKIEVVPISVGGNHGYTRLVEVAEASITTYISNPDHCYTPTEDEIEKWLVCDYDDMDEKDITRSELSEIADRQGFSLIISKPNFEFFLLATLSSYEFAATIDPTNYIYEINRQIDIINERDRKVNPWITDFMQIPKYGKRRHQSELCFTRIFDYHPDILDKILNEIGSENNSHYSEMPRLVNRIYNLIHDETT